MITAEFVANNLDELEADFQREYGIDIRAALFGKSPMGVRRLTALIHGLSPESATMRKVTANGQQWGPTEELLATLCELVDMTNRMFYQANFDTKKGNKVWDPIEIPRPYSQTRRERQRPRLSSDDELRSFFGLQSEAIPGALGVVITEPRFDPTDVPLLPSEDEDVSE